MSQVVSFFLEVAFSLYSGCKGLSRRINAMFITLSG